MEASFHSREGGTYLDSPVPMNLEQAQRLTGSSSCWTGCSSNAFPSCFSLLLLNDPHSSPLFFVICSSFDCQSCPTSFCGPTPQSFSICTISFASLLISSSYVRQILPLIFCPLAALSSGLGSGASRDSGVGMDSVSGFVLGSGMFGSGCYVVLPVQAHFD